MGQSYNADFLKRSFSSSVASNGQIFVNRNFQLASVHTAADGNTAARSNIFAFGDGCRTPANEVKNIPSIKFLAPFIAKSVSAVARGETPNSPMPLKIPVMAGISVGRTYGIFVANSFVMGGEGHGKSKFEYPITYCKQWSGDLESLQGMKAFM